MTVSTPCRLSKFTISGIGVRSAWGGGGGEGALPPHMKVSRSVRQKEEESDRKRKEGKQKVWLLVRRPRFDLSPGRSHQKGKSGRCTLVKAIAAQISSASRGNPALQIPA